MTTVAKKDIAAAIAVELGISRKRAGNMVQIVIDNLVKQLEAGNTVQLREFGTFTIKQAKPRMVHNFGDGPVETNPTPRASFKASKQLNRKLPPP